jgi:hypothetical protein
MTARSKAGRSILWSTAGGIDWTAGQYAYAFEMIARSLTSIDERACGTLTAERYRKKREREAEGPGEEQWPRAEKLDGKPDQTIDGRHPKRLDLGPTKGNCDT